MEKLTSIGEIQPRLTWGQHRGKFVNFIRRIEKKESMYNDDQLSSCATFQAIPWAVCCLYCSWLLVFLGVHRFASMGKR